MVGVKRSMVGFFLPQGSGSVAVGINSFLDITILTSHKDPDDPGSWVNVA